MKRTLTILLALIMVMSSAGCVFAASDSAEPTNPTGVFVTGTGSVYAVEQSSNAVFVYNGSWSHEAGKILSKDVYGEANGSYLDGIKEYALFNKPTDIVPFMDGYAISDTENSVIRYLIKNQVRTLGGSGKAELKDGKGAACAFNHPTALATDGTNLYIADTGNNAVRMMDKSGKVTTLVKGLDAPRGLAYYKDTLYIADTGNHRIMLFKGDTLSLVAGDSSYIASDVEGKPVEGGYQDGAAKNARFSNPTGIAVDEKTDIIYVGDCGNNAIRAINGNMVTTVLKADAMKMEKFPSEPVDLYIAGNTLYAADSFAGLCTIDLNDAVKTGSADKAFSDVKAADWFNPAVTYAYNNNLFNGTSKVTFSPGAPMTRGMFVTVISRLHTITYASDIIRGDSTFYDVNSNTYYAAPCAWAADNKIVFGIGGGCFAPENSVTRAQMAVIMYNYAEYAGENTAVTADARAKMNAMPDAAQVESWAKDAVAWAMGSGIINGKDGKIAANATATRAEVAQIIYNYANR